MPDYREMYLTLFRATENAIRQLTAAQQACEELYIASCEDEPRLFVLPDTPQSEE